MQTVTTITPKYQVHIPTAIREAIGLVRHGKAIIEAEKDLIIIRPIKTSILSLGGRFKVKYPIKAENIRDVIGYADGKR